MNLQNLTEKELSIYKEVIEDEPQKEELPIRDVLLSINPKYVRKIKARGKLWEFRKKIWSNNKIIDKIYLYETSPKQRIIGYFRTNQIITANPKQLWCLCKDQAGITKDQFFIYYNGHDQGHAIKISQVHFFENPIDPYKQLRGFHAPQNFMYITIIPEQINKKNNSDNGGLNEQIGFKLSRSLKIQLEDYAAKHNKSVSKIIRETLRDQLNEVKQTKPINSPNLSPPPRPKRPKKSQKKITESYYPQNVLNSEDRQALLREIQKGITLTKTNYCEKCDKRYSEPECPYCEETKEGDN